MAWEEGGSEIFVALWTLLSSPERRWFPIHLAVSLAAGHGLAAIAGGVGSRWPGVGRGVVPIAFAAWAVESVLAGPARLPVTTFQARDPAYARFLVTAGPGAVVDLPTVPSYRGAPGEQGKAIRSRYVFDQTIHHHPLHAAVGSRLYVGRGRTMYPDPIFETIADRARPGGDRPPLPADWRPDPLLSAGFRWVVLHPDAMEPRELRSCERDLTAVLGQPRRYPDEVLLYRIPDGPVGMTDRPGPFPPPSPEP
jgi:hypothetical protein